MKTARHGRTAAAFVGLLLGFCLHSTGTLHAETAADAPAASDEAQRLADRIDELIAARWAADGITPAPISDDAEFYRRASLDLCGRTPPGSEVRDFIADNSPDKRRAAIDRMLSGPTYIVNATNRWREAMIPEASAQQEARFSLPGFESWLRSRIAENRNFAEIAREMLTLPIGGDSMAAFLQPTEPTPAAFYQAKQGKPEELGAATSRLFLGVRLECAQCHDHPFDSWKREQFWEYAAFFGDLQPMQPPESLAEVVSIALPDKRSLKIPETDIVVTAGFLDGQRPNWNAGSAASTRDVLAEWITSRDNPWFARAAANRVWAQMFGIGLVEPLDDFSPNNPPSHPELLDDLATAFADQGYDLRFLTRAIALSQTYQRTSRRTHDSQDDPRTFARVSVRAMSPEQIFDSLAQATGYLQPFDPEAPLDFNNDPARQEFLETFANDSESTIERQSTILQALTLMNGAYIAEATDIVRSRTLTAVVEAPFLDVSEKIEALFFAALSRSPLPEELSKFREYVEAGGPTGDQQQALADVYWAILNSSEFAVNH
ncbi:MAG: DUF1553 domain-containing protein [Planctomyces sp.]|nr:DUF1553 domain-containing protein [Planctomyces sp.]